MPRFLRRTMWIFSSRIVLPTCLRGPRREKAESDQATAQVVVVAENPEGSWGKTKKRGREARGKNPVANKICPCFLVLLLVMGCDFIICVHRL